VRITEETDYPFRERVCFKLATEKPVTFPFALRIPGWCAEASVRINGKALGKQGQAGQYLVVEREWQDGDIVELHLPMRLELRRFEQNQDAVSIERGPLTYSLKIGELWKKYDDPIRQPFCDAEAWPAWEVFATSPWNYGLVLDDRPLEEQLTVLQPAGALPRQPFDGRHPPITIKARGRRIEQWQADRHNLAGLLQPSPARVAEGEPEDIELIPMGCARLRISAFPLASPSAGAHAWSPPPRVPHRASHEHDDILALSDGREPRHSGDHDVPRFTWWPRRGTREWITYDFAKPIELSEVSVYWFDDEGIGLCRVPKSWQLSYRDGDGWLPVTPRSQAPVEKDRFNRFTFEPITTTQLRIDVELRDGYSGGILEWIPGRVDPS
jgi:hypothetical protein